MIVTVNPTTAGLAVRWYPSMPDVARLNPAVVVTAGGVRLKAPDVPPSVLDAAEAAYEAFRDGRVEDVQALATHRQSPSGGLVEVAPAEAAANA